MFFVQPFFVIIKLQKTINKGGCTMSKLYNTQDDFTSKFKDFLKNAIPNIKENHLKILPFIIFGMIISESCVPSDIAKVLKGDFSKVQHDSVVTRIRRFFSNRLFKPYLFYQKLIIHVLNNFIPKHNDKIIYITFDHMFSKHNYTVLMFTMRIGTFGIPIWFKCFKNYSNNDAFKLKTMEDGIKSVSKLFKNTDYKLVFLADRWFGSSKILSIIASLGHIYCIRLKGNICIYYEDGKKVKAKKLKHRKYHSVIHKDVLITDDRFKTTIVYSCTNNTKDPWIIVTNGDTSKALKSYSYRFGSIETMFKAQKSNGFNLEKVSNSTLIYFETMYTCICTCITYLTILGIDYSKNTHCYKDVKIETHKTYLIDGKKIKKRIMSLFNVGLTLFKRAFNSDLYIRIPVTFKLYDI